MWPIHLLLLVCFAIELVSCKKNLDVLRIKFRSAKQRSAFRKFEAKHNGSFANLEELDSNSVLTSVDSNKSLALKNYLYENKIFFNEVQKRTADHRGLTGRASSSKPVYERVHMEYKDILKLLIKWKKLTDKAYENKVNVLEIGRTAKNQPIVIAKITENVHEEHNGSRSHIFIECGIHAREWASIDTCLFIMNELVFNTESYGEAMKRFVFHFLPVMNPDGYIFSWTTNRWWRKNLRKTKNSCMGVDLNRNFDVNFGNPTNSYCFEDWKGFKPFSEKESQAERDYLNELNAKGNKLDLFIAFHSYGQQITYPYGYSAKKIKNWKESDDLLKTVTKNLETYNAVDYRYGQTFFVIYPASGGSDDWTAYNNLARFVFVMELRDKGTYGFFIPEEKIAEVAMDGLVALNTILNQIHPNIVKIKPQPASVK